VAVFTKAIHSTRKQHIPVHLTKTAQYIAEFSFYKYMNSHSTIQYIYLSTIQVHEHYETQETENAEETKMNILPGNELGPSSL
jgi:hypothetical protein